MFSSNINAFHWIRSAHSRLQCSIQRRRHDDRVECESFFFFKKAEGWKTIEGESLQPTAYPYRWLSHVARAPGVPLLCASLGPLSLNLNWLAPTACRGQKITQDCTNPVVNRNSFFSHLFAGASNSRPPCRKKFPTSSSSSKSAGEKMPRVSRHPPLSFWTALDHSSLRQNKSCAPNYPSLADEEKKKIESNSGAHQADSQIASDQVQSAMPSLPLHACAQGLR